MPRQTRDRVRWPLRATPPERERSAGPPKACTERPLPRRATALPLMCVTAVAMRRSVWCCVRVGLKGAFELCGCETEWLGGLQWAQTSIPSTITSFVVEWNSRPTTVFARRIATILVDASPDRRQSRQICKGDMFLVSGRESFYGVRLRFRIGQAEARNSVRCAKPILNSDGRLDPASVSSRNSANQKRAKRGGSPFPNVLMPSQLDLHAHEPGSGPRDI